MNYRIARYHDIAMPHNHVPFWWPNAELIQLLVNPVGWVGYIILTIILGSIAGFTENPIAYILSIVIGVTYPLFTVSLTFRKTISENGGYGDEFGSGPGILMRPNKFLALSSETQKELRAFAKVAIKTKSDALEFGKIVDEYYALEHMDMPQQTGSFIEHHKAVIKTRKAAKEEERRQLDEAMRVIQTINRKYEING